jgi:hypothetical protein
MSVANPDADWSTITTSTTRCRFSLERENHAIIATRSHTTMSPTM